MKKSPAERNQENSVEDIFRSGFEGAETAPPSRIWENLDRELDNRELNRYRKQVFWYRSVAAACLLLLLSGGLFVWQYSSQTPPSIAASSGATSAGGNVRPGQQASETQIQDKSSVKENLPATPSVSGPLLAKQAENAPQQPVEGFEAEQVNAPILKSEASYAVKPTQRKTAGTAANLIAGTEDKVGSKALAVTVEDRSRESLNGKIEEKSILLDAGSSSAIAMATLTGDSSTVKQPTILLAQKKPELPGVPVEVETGKKEEKQASGLGKWSVGLAYTPQYAYSPVKIGQEPGTASSSSKMAPNQMQLSNQYQEAIDEYNNSYTPGYSYSATVGASYKLSDKWQLESGFLYSQNEATTQHTLVLSSIHSGAMENYVGMLPPAKIEPIFSAATASAGSEVVSISRTEQYSVKYKYQQVGVPVRVAFRQDLNKFYAFLSGGFNLNFLLKNSIEADNSRIEAVQYSYQDSESPYRTWQWALATSAGVGYHVNKKMSLIFGPEATYSLSPMVKDDKYKAKNYQVGMSVGARWHLSGK
ncbi:MAG: outer membrane beta-barrel protein [Rufibacter sp.]